MVDISYQHLTVEKPTFEEYLIRENWKPVDEFEQSSRFLVVRFIKRLDLLLQDTQVNPKVLWSYYTQFLKTLVVNYTIKEFRVFKTKDVNHPYDFVIYIHHYRQTGGHSSYWTVFKVLHGYSVN